MTRTAETLVQSWVQNPPDAPAGWWLGFFGVQVAVLACVWVLIQAFKK